MRRFTILAVTMLVGALTLVACGGDDDDTESGTATTAAATATPTDEPVTAVVTTTPTVAEPTPTDEPESTPTDTPAPTPTNEPEPTPTVTSEPIPTDTPELTPELSEEEQLRAEAAEVCPEAFLQPCSDAYVENAQGSRQAALCVTNEGLWFFETPTGDIGNACTSGGVIVAIVGGE